MRSVKFEVSQQPWCRAREVVEKTVDARSRADVEKMRYGLWQRLGLFAVIPFIINGVRGRDEVCKEQCADPVE